MTDFPRPVFTHKLAETLDYPPPPSNRDPEPFLTTGCLP